MSSEAGSLVPITAERGLGANRTQVRHRDVAGETPGDWFDNIRATSNRSSVDAGSALVVTHSDEALMEQLGTGNKDALALLFRRYARMVRAVAYRILRNPSEAEDLLQDVFLFLFLKSQLFDRARGPARSWIVQVTYHRAIDRRRYLISRRF
jgi:RNA polymerase sigma-70 factor (ECF subfamily)